VALYPTENVVLMVFKHKETGAHGALYVTRDGKEPGSGVQLIIFKPLIITKE